MSYYNDRFGQFIEIHRWTDARGFRYSVALVNGYWCLFAEDGQGRPL